MPTNEQCKKFISEIAPLVQKYAKERGYKIASTVIAQACCESAYGTCALSPYHNYFGMKCGGAWKGKSVNLKTKEEYSPGTLTNITANFRVYDSMEAGVKGYYDFIAWSHYANLKTATTYRQYAERLQADGYATSSTYAQTLCSIVEKWGLTKYDPEETKKPLVEIEVYKPILTVGDIGDDVRLMQFLLNLKGYSCGSIDGDFGTKTKEALGDYQRSHPECGPVDYKCGPKTWGSLLS